MLFIYMYAWFCRCGKCFEYHSQELHTCNGDWPYDMRHMAENSISWPNQFHSADQVPLWQHYYLSAAKICQLAIVTGIESKTIKTKLIWIGRHVKKTSMPMCLCFTSIRDQHSILPVEMQVDNQINKQHFSLNPSCLWWRSNAVGKSFTLINYSCRVP